MNVYDFDGTIYASDSVADFAFWCAKRHPKLWVTYLPRVIGNTVLFLCKRIKKYELERRLFEYLGMIDDLDEQIEKFWDANEKKIAKWYLRQKKPDDLIISASPDCIIAPIARRLGVRYKATEYDSEYGVLLDNLMLAKEKARYIFDQGFPEIEEFYSDSLSDTPLALCAEKAFFVTNHAQKINPWPKLEGKTRKKVHSAINTGTDVHI